MAKILWKKGLDPSSTQNLAKQAREDYLKAGKSTQDELDEVEAWIKENAR